VTEPLVVGRLLVAGFRPGPAGVGRDMINLMNGLAKGGVEVHALVETGDNPDFQFLDPSVQRHLEPLGKGRRGVARMRAVVEKHGPDAVIANKDRVTGLLVEAVAELEPRPRTLVRVGIDQPAKLSHRNPLSRWRSRRLLRATYRKADVLVGVSQGVCETPTRTSALR